MNKYYAKNKTYESFAIQIKNLLTVLIYLVIIYIISKISLVSGVQSLSSKDHTKYRFKIVYTALTIS